MIYGSGLQLQAATPVAGTALANGTPAILSWTAPNDGGLHRAVVFGVLDVAVQEVGGQVNVAYTLPDGTANSFAALNAGMGAGPANLFSYTFVVKAGTTVTVAQATALTGGAATLWAEIWGS